MPDKLKSRKLWVSLIAAVLIVFNDAFEFGLDSTTITAIVSTVVGYVLGQGAVDAAERIGAAKVQSTAIEYSGPINP